MIFNSQIGNIEVLMLKGEKGDKGDKGDAGDYVAQQYTSLMNKPSIDGTTLDGAMTASGLGLLSHDDIVVIEDVITLNAGGHIDKVYNLADYGITNPNNWMVLNTWYGVNGVNLYERHIGVYYYKESSIGGLAFPVPSVWMDTYQSESYGNKLYVGCDNLSTTDTETYYLRVVLMRVIYD